MSVSDFFTDKRVLITGGAGCLGSHLAERLLDMGALVTIYDNFIHGEDSERIVQEIQKHVSANRLRVIKGDVLNFELVKEVVKEQGYIFHFAALPSHRLALKNPRDYALIDLMGTINILEAIRLTEPSPPLLLASSNKVYGRATEPYREDMQLNPEGPYAQAKACCEAWCRQYSSYYGLTIPIIRYHHVIGARTQPDREIAIFTERVINGEPPIIHGHFGKDGFKPCAADYTHVYDAIDGTILVASKVIKGFDVFNLATGKVTTVLEIAELVMKSLGKWIKPVFKEMLPHESLIHRADITKIKRLGFKPKYSVEQGVRHYVEWRLKVGPRKVIYE